MEGVPFLLESMKGIPWLTPSSTPPPPALKLPPTLAGEGCPQPAVSMGSASGDWTDHGLEIFGKIAPESFKKQTLKLLCAGHYVPSTHIILGIISNLEMT